MGPWRQAALKSLKTIYYQPGFKVKISSDWQYVYFRLHVVLSLQNTANFTMLSASTALCCQVVKCECMIYVAFQESELDLTFLIRLVSDDSKNVGDHLYHL